MAEFLEVMGQKKRMCKKYAGGGICQSIDYNICPLKGHDLCGKPIALMNIDKIREGEEIIMRWAAENPEPVYPTFREWLISIGVIDQMSTHSVIVDTLTMMHIPADLAQKLELQPKEGNK